MSEQSARNVEQMSGLMRRAWLRLRVAQILPIALLAAGFALFFFFDFDRYLSLDVLRDNRLALTTWAASTGVSGWATFVGAYALVVALSLPGATMMTVVGGFLFGPLVGTVLSVVGATTGATAIFLAARHAFADYFRAKLGPAVCRMEAEFHENALSYLMFLRLMPVFPFWIVNLVPALLGVRVGIYILATAVGIVPGTAVYAFLGDGLGSVLESGGDIDLQAVYQPRFLLPILGLGVLALVPVIYRKCRRGTAE